MMQINDPAVQETTTPLFRLAFRPFFLGGALFSVISLLLWGGSLFYGARFTPYGGIVWWHMHEMIFGFTLAIIAGFLLTAVQTWTGIKSIKGMPLAAFCLLWLAARVMLLFPDAVNPWLAGIVDIAFPLVTAGLMANCVLRKKMWKNLVFAPVLLLMTLASGMMHWGVINQDYALAHQGAYGGVYLIALLMVILGGRVIPFFTVNKMGFEKSVPSKPRELCAIIPLALIVLMMLSGLNNQLPMAVAVLAGVSFVANLLRMVSWKGWKTTPVPLLWSLHVAYLFIVLGLLFMAMHYAGLAIEPTIMIHAMTVGGIGGLVLAMISRVSLGHTGRPLNAGMPIQFAFLMIVMAAVVRLLPTFMPSLYNSLVLTSICLWSLAYGIFFIVYLPILSQPRVDGNPG
ncbi:NnrS family protein [Endozoicomonas sp. OPT23]|uniref:NnrS family protein n=1 Tax=Endozoicomonas sp. OPT23 TaxID=2072845 RepID=UPI00129B66A7|nr:NnrS family protein [Endozoicomonas sp. OPT23]MRI31473.1 NnrS family protein [Endozoicomonas sp. OPT23]